LRRKAIADLQIRAFETSEAGWRMVLEETGLFQQLYFFEIIKLTIRAAVP
jgi:hypothetical protein